MIRILDYTEENRSFIKSLNYEWLEKYFSVEPTDVLQLEDPKKHILDKGGLIFYATYNDEIVGTSSLLLNTTHVYELGKMAITEAFQGRGIANVLMEHCIEKARSLRAVKLILYSNTKLTAAINLYKKYGFYEIPLLEQYYKRSDIKMEKIL